MPILWLPIALSGIVWFPITPSCIIVRQPSSYTLHRLLKCFFFMDSTPLDIALWVKHSRWPPFVQGQAIHSYYFQHNRGSFVFLVSIMGFLGMPYIMVLSEDILDIALWVKNPRWPPFLYKKPVSCD